MTVTNATPRPWIRDCDNDIRTWDEVDESMTTIATMVHDYEGMPVEANAALIVTAVNAHDALTQMLRRAVFAYFDNANGRYDLPEAMDNAAEMLDIRLGDCAECGDWAIVSDPELCERCEALS